MSPRRYEDHAEKYNSKKAELDRANAALAEADRRREELDTIVRDKKHEITEIAKALDGAKADERRREATDADADKELEKIMAKRAQHLAKQEQLVKQIRELGALPKEFEDYSSTSVKALYKKLSAVNKKLKDPKYRQVCYR